MLITLLALIALDRTAGALQIKRVETDSGAVLILRGDVSNFEVDYRELLQEFGDQENDVARNLLHGYRGGSATLLAAAESSGRLVQQAIVVLHLAKQSLDLAI